MKTNDTNKNTMNTVTAKLSDFRQAPRKMRMVANAVRGKKVAQALVNLDFIAKKASLPIKKLIMSALANAKAREIPTENLIVKVIKVDGGKILYRRLPAARGSAHRMRKRTCSVFVELAEASVKTKKTKIIKEAVVEPVKKTKTTKKVTKAKK